MKKKRNHVYEKGEKTYIWRVREYMYKEWENTCIKGERIHV
jgi:hypothetical protein